MKVIADRAAGRAVIEPRVFGDARGYFFESWNRERFAEASGVTVEFVQDNISYSARGVLRGLHYQCPSRRASSSACSRARFRRGGRHPPRLAHVRPQLSGSCFRPRTRVSSGCPRASRTDSWCSRTTHVPLQDARTTTRPSTERTVLWNDPALGIEWPALAPTLSSKDAAALPLAAICLSGCRCSAR